MAGRKSDESDLITLAFSMHANPGAYALLLGSGVSAPSGIPTAWGVLEGLVAQAASVAGAGTDEPLAWYEDRFGEPPTYERVLERLAPTQIERQRLLRSHFEANPEELEEGAKRPTAAHRAVAELVRAGSVKVIMTLNFDHLIEQALREVGIEPTVVASPSDIDGMAPLHTLEVCVFHLHGDYLTPSSMLNTLDELREYHPSTARLLRRILEDYGLLIAGWSSKYDPALRQAISEHYPSRFTLNWIEPGEASPEAVILRTLKKGLLINRDADEGFGLLADGIQALRARRARHPLSIPLAAEAAKRDLSGRTVAIDTHDRLQQEFSRLHALPEFQLAGHDDGGSYETLLARVEEAGRGPAALIAVAAYWGNPTTDKWWLKELPRFASPADGSGLVKLLSLRVVAGSVMFYSAGVAALAAGRLDLVAQLLALKRPRRYADVYETFAESLDSESAYEGAERKYTRVFEIVAPLLMDSLAVGSGPLEDAWEHFEVIRLSWAISHHRRFRDLQSQFLKNDQIFKAADVSYNELKKLGTETSADWRSRHEMWEERGKSLGDLCYLAPVGRPHVLTADYRMDESYQSPVAMRLIHDVEAEGAAHPYIASGLFTDEQTLITALQAVSTRLGMVGRELSRQRVGGRAGVIPMQMWLDSAETPHERAQKDRGTSGTSGE